MKRILIADDIADIRQLIRLSLEPLDVQLTEAGSAGEVLEEVRRAPPDLIILDVVLPDADGYTVCRTLRADPALAATPVMLLTARAQRADQEQAQAAGADVWMVKPFSPADLLQRVAQALA